ALAPETIFIADGHHRYETGLAYRRERGATGPDSILAFVSNVEEEGLGVLPTHRLLRAPLRLDPAVFEARLREAFAVAPLPAGSARPDGAIDVGLADRRFRLRPPGAAGGRGGPRGRPTGERAHARRRRAARRHPGAHPRRRARPARVHTRRRGGVRAGRHGPPHGPIPAEPAQRRGGPRRVPRGRADAGEVDVLLSEAGLGARFRSRLGRPETPSRAGSRTATGNRPRAAARA